MNRSVAVLGPGAVGGSLAVRLSTAGVPTTCVAHPEAAGVIALAGLVVESLRDGTLSARVEVVERLERPVGLLLVTVKAPMLAEALERVDPEAVADGVAVPLLNGLEHMTCFGGDSETASPPAASRTSRPTVPDASRSSRRATLP